MKKLTTTIKGILLLGLIFSHNDTYSQCSSCPLTGDSQIGTGQSKTYSVATLSGASYFWSVTGSLSISGLNTGSSVTIVGGQFSGTGKVCVTRYKSSSQPCCSCLDITVSTTDECPYFAPFIYAVNMRTSEANTICPEDVAALGVSNPLQGHTVQWSITPNAPLQHGSLTSTYLEFFDLPQYSQYNVSATFYCPNGQISGSRSLTVDQTLLNCDWIYPTIVDPGSGENELSLFPNPSNSSITINLPTNELPYNIWILSKDGNKVYDGRTEKPVLEIDISKLQQGLYFVNISRSDNWNKQIHFIKR
jgi:hypothetical protein